MDAAGRSRHHPEVTVALQGTLDTFALPDVLRLLASTKKTGRLHVTGSRGTGSVFVDGGSVVAAEASGVRNATSSTEVLFELLRYPEGSFVFDTDRPPVEPGIATDVEPLLVDAERLLEEWKGIEAVVPSLDAWVSLSPTLPRQEIVVAAGQWRAIVAVGSGCTIWSIGDKLGLSEVPVSRAVKELVEAGLALVGNAPERAATTDTAAGAFGVELPPGVQPIGAAQDKPVETAHIDTEAATERIVEPRDMIPPSVFADAPPDEADEVARQLANLSPRAARAVAAAAKASTPEEQEAALAEVPEDEEPINRGLLLKFLSSVRS